MSYLVVVPELVAAAATDLANIGSSISAANAAAAARPRHWSQPAATRYRRP